MCTPSLKEILFRRQKGLCWICLRPMSMTPGDKRFATFDHVVPLGASGANRPGNKLLAHKICNEVRGMRPIQGVKLTTIIARAHSRIGLAVQRRSQVRTT